MKTFTTLACLVALITTSTALAATKKYSRTSPTKQSGVLKSDSVSTRSETTELGSDNGLSALGHIELSPQAGATFVSGLTAGVVSIKASHILPVPALLYGELGLGMAFNTDIAVFPIDLGARLDFNLADNHSLKPFLHLSLGPAFATAGSTVVFHMFTGPGAMYRIARDTDVRVDMGLVMFETSPGFQFAAGVAL